MKTVFVSLGLLVSSLAFSADQFVDSHPHLVFKDVRFSTQPGWMDAGVLINNRVPGHSPNFLELDTAPKVFERIPLYQHAFETNYGRSVFVATTGTGTARGTAFLIGPNLVLTNKHVLANDSKCNRFAVTLNHSDETIPCKQVEYCDAKDDFCVIRMATLKNGREIGSETKPLKFATEKSASDAMAIVIGNALGLGIQAASYTGTAVSGTKIGHCVRVFSGNSGSPVLTESGKVLGIHYGRGSSVDLDCPADRHVGLAVSSTKILSALWLAKPDVFRELMEGNR